MQSLQPAAKIHPYNLLQSFRIFSRTCISKIIVPRPICLMLIRIPRVSRLYFSAFHECSVRVLIMRRRQTLEPRLGWRLCQYYTRSNMAWPARLRGRRESLAPIRPASWPGFCCCPHQWSPFRKNIQICAL